jgi:hypothetical protein
MFKYKRRPAITIFLLLLDHAIENDTYPEVLDVLGRGIEEAVARIDAAKTGSDDYAEVVIDTETEIIEGLLGAAYVVCQTQITAIAQAALDCRARIIKDGLAFTAFGDRDYEVRRMGARFDTQWSRSNCFGRLRTISSIVMSGLPAHGLIRKGCSSIRFLSSWRLVSSLARPEIYGPELKHLAIRRTTRTSRYFRQSSANGPIRSAR